MEDGVSGDRWWNRDPGICPVCKRRLKSGSALGSYKIPHEREYGPWYPDIYVCGDCHIRCGVRNFDDVRLFLNGYAHVDETPDPYSGEYAAAYPGAIVALDKNSYAKELCEKSDARCLPRDVETKDIMICRCGHRENVFNHVCFFRKVEYEFMPGAID